MAQRRGRDGSKVEGDQLSIRQPTDMTIAETPDGPVATVTSIKDAPKRQENEAAPLEAFGPQALKLQGDDWQITTCDGDQVYVFMATKRKGAKNYRIEEVYPGTTKRSTRLRKVKEPKDLVFVGKRHADIADVIEDIEDEVLGDFEEVPEGQTIH